MEFAEKTTSQFNDAIYQIQRLNVIWNECRSAREGGFLLKWRDKLHSAELELDCDAKLVDKERKTRFISDLKDVNLKIIKSENQIVLSKHKVLKLLATKNLFINLTEKEKILREVQELSGKGSKRLGEEEDAM